MYMHAVSNYQFWNAMKRAYTQLRAGGMKCERCQLDLEGLAVVNDWGRARARHAYEVVLHPRLTRQWYDLQLALQQLSVFTMWCVQQTGQRQILSCVIWVALKNAGCLPRETRLLFPRGACECAG